MTASWVSTLAAAAAAVALPGPDGSVGGRWYRHFGSGRNRGSRRIRRRRRDVAGVSGFAPPSEALSATGCPASASLASSSATVDAPPRSSDCSAAISSAVLPFCEFGDLIDLVAVLDRVLDEVLDVVQVGVAHRGQLDGRQVEVVFDAVLDPHRHQGIQAQLDQRHLPRQNPRARNPWPRRRWRRGAGRWSRPNPETTSRSRRPCRRPWSDCPAGSRHHLRRAAPATAPAAAVEVAVGIETCSATTPAPTAVGSVAAPATPRHDRVVDQGERLIDSGVHLHRRAARVPGQRGDQAGPSAGTARCSDAVSLRIRKHLRGSALSPGRRDPGCPSTRTPRHACRRASRHGCPASPQSCRR